MLHVASPMPVGEHRDSDLVTPAVEGMLRVLAAAHTSGARRVVLTSSADAATPASPDEVIDETVWTDVPAGRG